MRGARSTQWRNSPVAGRAVAGSSGRLPSRAPPASPSVGGSTPQSSQRLRPLLRLISQSHGGTGVKMDWISDCRHGWRALIRTPVFLVTSVTTLALAIGAVVGMFSVVNTVLLRPLPFPDADRLVVLAGTAPGSDMPERFGLGSEFYLHYKERSKL